jgi:hypothetical protein
VRPAGAEGRAGDGAIGDALAVEDHVGRGSDAALTVSVEGVEGVAEGTHVDTDSVVEPLPCAAGVVAEAGSMEEEVAGEALEAEAGG